MHAGREGLRSDQRPDRPFGLSSRLPIHILCLVPHDSRRQHHAGSNHLCLHLPRQPSCCHATVHHFSCCASLGADSAVSVQACEVHLPLAHVQRWRDHAVGQHSVAVTHQTKVAVVTGCIQRSSVCQDECAAAGASNRSHFASGEHSNMQNMLCACSLMTCLSQNSTCCDL